MAKFKIQLNDVQNIQDVLQEAYSLADEQITQAQNEINKLAVATQLHNEPMDAKTKYAKAINDYMGMKDKAISKKIEIAKVLSEIYAKSMNGMALDSSSSKPMDFNFEDIKKMVDESYGEMEKTKTIELGSRKK